MCNSFDLNHSLAQRPSDLGDRTPLETKVQAKSGGINQEGCCKVLTNGEEPNEEQRAANSPRSLSNRQTIWQGVLLH